MLVEQLEIREPSDQRRIPCSSAKRSGAARRADRRGVFAPATKLYFPNSIVYTCSFYERTHLVEQQAAPGPAAMPQQLPRPETSTWSVVYRGTLRFCGTRCFARTCHKEQRLPPALFIGAGAPSKVKNGRKCWRLLRFGATCTASWFSKHLGPKSSRRCSR